MKYNPGKCNIGPKEIKKRYTFGIVGFIASAALFIILYRLNAGYLFYLFEIIPILIGFIGIYQGYFRFCVANAYRGIYDLSDVGGGKGVIRDDISHREDLKHARIIIYYAVLSSILLGIIVTILVMVLK